MTYPALDDAMRYKAGVVEAVQWLKEQGAWTGNNEVRQAKFRGCVERLATCYGRAVPVLAFEGVERGARATSSGSSSYTPISDTITLRGRYSVLTLLHEFAHALGKGERGACKWSINLFKRVFPDKFAQLTAHGHFLTRGEQ